MAPSSAKKKRSQPKLKSGKGGGGKKARIAAQRRDRYWGEDVVDDEDKKVQLRRPGEGRRGPQQTEAVNGNSLDSVSKFKVSSQFVNPRNDQRTSELLRRDTGSDSDESGSSDGENMDSTSPTPLHFSKLMKSLATTKRRKRNRDTPSRSDNEDQHGESDAESTESHNKQSPSEMPLGLDDNSEDLPIVENDWFTDHFSREPLMDSEIPTKLQTLHQQTKALSVEDASLELQASVDLFPSLQLAGMTEASPDQKIGGTHRRTVQRLARQWWRTFEASGSRDSNGQSGDVHSAAVATKAMDQNLVAALLVPAVRTYADVLLTADSDTSDSSSRKGQSSAAKNATAIHTTLAWHIVQHVYKSRSLIDRHNRRLHRQAERGNELDHTVAAMDPDWCRDQGFTRPTVLVLLPTRHCCYDFVTLLLSLLQDNTDSRESVVNMDRFDQEYGPASVAPAANDDTEEDSRRRAVLRQKGADWNDLFGDDRNDDDDFKVGLQLNWKRGGRSDTASGQPSEDVKPTKFSGKLYSDFYRSDIILASPLGLKMTVQGGADEDGPEKANGSSADFLTSIEICLVARADVLWQQNFDHIPDILSLLNQTPKAMNHTDFSRVRQYILAGQAANWRQLIVSGNLSDPAILSCFKKYASSSQGIVKIKRKAISVTEASIASVWWPNLNQVFQRVSTASFASAGEDRLKYFLDQIWPKIESQHRGHTMIFVPSYFDFCSLRNALLLKQEQYRSGSNIDFVSVTEYSRPTEVARGRARFLQGRKPVLLYTGRAHYFLRHAIKGVRHLIFFGLPEVASFYAEHVNRLNEGLKTEMDDDIEDTSCLALFTKYDAHALERIVGTANCSRMVKGEKSTFLFSSP
jgi:U3 small nucleolar RNA-associated protein 25